ncbi:hypothetical protein JG688_00010013, partial [Phytophthora aleatoria]
LEKKREEKKQEDRDASWGFREDADEEESEEEDDSTKDKEELPDYLRNEVDDLEDMIHAKDDQRTKTGSTSGSAVREKRNINEELYGYNSNEDDLYDRTKANQQKVTGSPITPGAAAVKAIKRATKIEVLTAESIQANVTKLEDQLKKLQDDLSAASAKAAANQATPDTKEADSLDSLWQKRRLNCM